MKVLLAYHGCMEKLGGAQRAVWNLANVYKSMGFRVIILHSCNSVHLKKENKIMMISLPAYSFGGITWFPSLRFVRYIFNLVKGSDIVHVCFSETPYQMLLALYSRLLGKIVISSHLAFISYIFHHNLIIRMISPILIFFKLVIAYLSDLIHTPLFHEVHIIRKLPLKDVKVVAIPHGIPLSIDKVCEFYKASSIIDSSDRNGNELHNIMFLGRFTIDKGAFILLDALYYVISSGLRVKLLIVGPKSIALETIVEYIRKHPERFARIKDFIEIIGEVDEETKYKLISSVDCGIIPSLSDAVEAFSIALSEFNMLKRIVIASAIGALKLRLIECPKAGLLVKPRDPKALAKAIRLCIAMLNSKEERDIPLLPDVLSVNEEAKIWQKTLSYFIMSKRLDKNKSIVKGDAK